LVYLKWMLLLFCFFFLSVLSQRPTLQQQPVLSCNDVDGVHLEVKEARINIGNQVAFNTRLYHVNGVPMFPGPTITTRAGETCRITITNNLVGPPCNEFTNQPVCPQVTGLHLHGSHVSYLEDDIIYRIQPGENHTWTSNFHEDHLMGTHWYHPHFHGSSALQVTGGLHGVFLVLPAASYVLPADLQVLYDNARVLVLSPVLFYSPNPNGGIFAPRNYTELADEIAGNTIQTNEVITGEGIFYAINGQYQPIIDINPDEASLLRFGHTAGVRVVEFELVDPNHYCSWTLVARDGIFQYTPYQTVDAVVIPQAGRADVAVKCSSAAAGQTIDVRLYPNPSRDWILGRLNRPDQPIVFSFRISTTSNVVPFPTSQAPLPSYLDSLMTPDTVLSETSKCPKNTLNLLMGVDVDAEGHSYGSINGKRMPNPLTAVGDDRYVDTLCVGKTYEILLQVPADADGGYPDNGFVHGIPSTVPTGVHPFHVHINPFMVVTGDGSLNGISYRKGEWRDTIGLLFTKQIIFRYKPQPYPGDFVVHCHIYEHGDRGMMGFWNVVAPENCPAPTAPCPVTPPPGPPPPPSPTPNPTPEPNPNPNPIPHPHPRPHDPTPDMNDGEDSGSARVLDQLILSLVVLVFTVFRI
jgi:FtsP/CotA-like multicopper oxidase with cupredoxin domain